MTEHYQNDAVVTPEEVERAEKTLNDHSRSWGQILNIGEASGTGQPRRCNRAMVGRFHTIPSLQGLRKDHRGHLDGDPNKGPKLRPLAAANKAPNAALGNLAAQITKAVGNNVSEKYGSELISTEQLKRRIEETNKQISDNWESSKVSVTTREERLRGKKPLSI